MKAFAGATGGLGGPPAPRAALSPDGCSLAVRVPLSFRNSHGRKHTVVVPDGAAICVQRGKPDPALLKALVRAFRWRKLLESGAYATVQDLAAAEKLNPCYVGRVLRLTLLSPDIVAAILDGRHVATAEALMRPFPLEWMKQPLRFVQPS